MRLQNLSLFLIGTFYSTLGLNCKWTKCEEKLIDGQDVCNNYGYGKYDGKTNTDRCVWDRQKVQCCMDGDCKLSTSCYGMFFDPDGGWICNRDFGKDWVPNGETDDSDCSWSLKRHECCKRINQHAPQLHPNDRSGRIRNTKSFRSNV